MTMSQAGCNAAAPNAPRTLRIRLTAPRASRDKAALNSLKGLSTLHPSKDYTRRLDDRGTIATTWCTTSTQTDRLPISRVVGWPQDERPVCHALRRWLFGDLTVGLFPDDGHPGRVEDLATGGASRNGVSRCSPHLDSFNEDLHQLALVVGAVAPGESLGELG